VTASHSGNSEPGKLDPSLVAGLYVEHSEQLRRFLLGLLGDATLVGDVLQATFTKALEKAHQAGAGSRKAWLFRVAYNEAMAVRRGEGVHERAVRKLAGGFQQACGDSQTDDPLIRLETIDRVRHALKTLPAEQAEVVRLRIYEDKKFSSIAEELNIPLGTALARMRAALKKLRNQLGGGESDE